MVKIMILYFLIYICISSFAFAQVEGYDGQYNLNAVGGGEANVVRTFDTRYMGIKGTPFFRTSWNEAELHFTSGRKVKNVLIKLNLLHDEVMVKRSSGDSIILDKRDLITILLSDSETGQDIIFKRGSDPPDLKSGFYHVIYDGKVSLVARYKKDFVKADYKGGYSPGKISDEIVDEVVYYLQRTDLSYVKVKLNKRSILSAINDEKLNAFVKTNKLRIKSVEDVKILLAHYEGL
jgi:hypothetical protein